MLHRSLLLTCRLGSARVGQAPIGLSAVSSWKLQAHSRFGLILPSRLRRSLSYSALKRNRGEKRVCSQLRSKKEKQLKSTKHGGRPPAWSQGPLVRLSVCVSAFADVPLHSDPPCLPPFSPPLTSYPTYSELTLHCATCQEHKDR